MLEYQDGPIRVRASQMEDAYYLSSRLRQSDQEEVWASHHKLPLDSLLTGYEISKPCLTIERKGVPVAMFGVVPGSMTDTACIWLLGSDEINRMKKGFIRICKTFIPMFHMSHFTLFNYVDARNKLSIRWLKLCGAEIEEAQPFGVEGRPFHLFCLRRKESQSCA